MEFMARNGFYSSVTFFQISFIEQELQDVDIPIILVNLVLHFHISTLQQNKSSYFERSLKYIYNLRRIYV